jgi:hypothetical protein
MSKTSRISKLRSALKTPGIEKTVQKSFNLPKSPKAASPKTASPKTASPKAASPKVASPKAASPKAASPKAAKGSRSSSKVASPKVTRSRSSSKASKRSRSASKKSSRRNSITVDLEIPIPGVISTETFEERMVVSRPSIEKYANTDILKNNPKISMEELAVLLGITKINLPKIETKINSVPLHNLPKSASPKRSSVKTSLSESKAASPKKKDICKDIKIGGVPIKKDMISIERSTKTKPVYKNEELKEIARQLDISPTGTKDQIVNTILKELENRGC